MFGRYASLILSRAFRSSVLFTDKLSIVAGVLLPAIVFVTGEPMPEWVGGYVAWFIIIAVGGGVILRLVSAPFFIWREQTIRIGELEAELAKPEQIERQRIAENLGDIKSALAAELSGIGQSALNYSRRDEDRHPPTLPTNTAHEMMKQISYDERLYSLCDQYIETARMIVSQRFNQEDDSTSTAVMHRIGRETFRMLHRA